MICSFLFTACIYFCTLHVIGVVVVTTLLLVSKILGGLCAGIVWVPQKIIWVCCGLNSGYCCQSSLAGAEYQIFTPLVLQQYLLTVFPPYLQLVVVRADLNGHLKALKDYFLLAKGDFFQVNDQQSDCSCYTSVLLIMLRCICLHCTKKRMLCPGNERGNA